MPRRLHAGRPGSRVIPTGWAAAHRPTIETSLNGAVAIRDPDDFTQTWDTGLKQNVSTHAAPYYTGPARIQQLQQAADRVVSADDPEQVADYLVVITADQDVAENHRVRVTTADDTQLEGREMQVVRVVLGTERWERDLFCTLVD